MLPRAITTLIAGLSFLALPQAALGATVSPGETFAISGGGVIRVDLVTGAQAPVSSGQFFKLPNGIDFGPDNQIYVVDRTAFGPPGMQGPGGVIRVDPSTGMQTAVSSGGSFQNPNDLVIAPNGDIFVVQDAGLGAVFRVDPVTGAQTPVTSAGNFVEPSSIAIASNGELIVGDVATHKIVGVNPASGAQVVIASGGWVNSPYAIDVAHDGQIFVGDPNLGGVIRIDPTTGAQARISTGIRPFGIATPGSDILVGDRAAVIRIDRVTGAQTTVSSGGSPGALFVSDFLRFEAPASAGPNVMVLRRSGSNLELSNNGSIVSSAPLIDASRAVIVGANGVDDTLTIDYSGGFFFLPGGIHFNAGTGTDRINVRADRDFTLTDSRLFADRVDVTLSGVEQAGLTGGPGNNIIDGLAFTGTLTANGRAGNDVLLGGSGGDVLMGWSGDDELDGGGGIDKVVESGDVDFRLASSSLSGRGLDDLAGIEEASLAGGPSDNTFTVSGWTALATLSGGAGIGDRVVAANDVSFNLTNTRLARSGLGAVTLAGIEEAALTGGWANNSLNASLFTGNVVLDGREGNDVLKGGTRGDTLLGGPGADVLTGGGGEDALEGGLGTDRVLETANASFILTDTSLTSARLTDGLTSIEVATLTGGDAANSLNASAFTLGGAILNGGGGNDTLLGGSRNDTLTGGTGADTMRGNAGDDTLFARDATTDTAVDGGPHVAGDRAQVDPSDPRTGIEIFLA